MRVILRSPFLMLDPACGTGAFVLGALRSSLLDEPPQMKAMAPPAVGIAEIIHQGGTAPPMTVLSAQRLTFRLLVEGGRWKNRTPRYYPALVFKTSCPPLSSIFHLGVSGGT